MYDSGWIISISQVCQQFLDTNDEEEIVATCLDLIVNQVGSQGASFIPFDDYGQPMQAILRGNVPDNGATWVEYLASPDIRQRCASCASTQKLVHDCPLTAAPFMGISGIYCLPLKRSGREYGIVNLYISDPQRISGQAEIYLQILLDVTTLALEGARFRRKELESQRDLQQMSDLEYKTMILERTRLAREIHDGLAQTLGFMKLQAAQVRNALAREDYARVKELLDAYYATLSDAYQEARLAIDGLRISTSNAALSNWLPVIAGEFQEISGLCIRVNPVDLHSELPPEVHAQLIRIVQEALSNIRKHAKANQVTINCQELGNELVMEIHDDGCGFSPEDVTSPSRHGLQGMRERAELIGAEFQIISQPQQGTTVRVRLPMSKKVIGVMT